MSFYTSLSGLKGSQTDMSVISNNIANAGSIGFKRSKAQFGDIFASSPTQSTKTIAGEVHASQRHHPAVPQGSYEASEKTLDLAIVGEGMFVVKGNLADRGDPPIRATVRSNRPPTTMSSTRRAQSCSFCPSMPTET